MACNVRCSVSHPEIVRSVGNEGIAENREKARTVGV